MFNIWFNTFFVEGGVLEAPKRTIDKANKDKKHKIYPETFQVNFEFDTIEGDAASAEATSRAIAEQEALAIAGGGDAAAGATPSSPSERPEGAWDDADLTTDDEDDDEDEWEGLPIADV